MSKIAEKLISNQKLNDEDWNDHLLESHKSAPSMTPAAFASYKTKEGLTSYELLARSISGLNKTARVLDLACGDGYLFQFLRQRLGPDGFIIGVDMSDGELAVAQKNYAHNKQVSLFQSTAQSLPLPDESVDAIVCHMAFMLMLPLDPVVSEIHRTLKSNSRFSAVIGNSRGKSGLFGDIATFCLQFIESRYPKIIEARWGDPRVQSEIGLKDLFSPALGFKNDMEFSDIVLLVTTDPEGVWDFMKDMYFVSMMPLQDQQVLHLELVDFAKARMNSEGLLSFEFQMRMFSVSKA